MGSCSVTTNAQGNATFEETLDNPGDVGAIITATATDEWGNTSEFSPARADFDFLLVNVTQDEADPAPGEVTLRSAIIIANHLPGHQTIVLPGLSEGQRYSLTRARQPGDPDEVYGDAPNPTLL